MVPALEDGAVGSLDGYAVRSPNPPEILLVQISPEVMVDDSLGFGVEIAVHRDAISVTFHLPQKTRDFDRCLDCLHLLETCLPASCLDHSRQ